MAQVYDLWADEHSDKKTKNEQARIRMHFPAPKMPLPGHAESYNPPPEYLFDEDELKKWEVSLILCDLSPIVIVHLFCKSALWIGHAHLSFSMLVFPVRGTDTN